MSFQYFRYSNELDREFSKAVISRVNTYFAENKIPKHGDHRMILKTLLMLSGFFGPYVLMLFQPFSYLGGYYALWALMGVAMAGIGMGIMHDSIHGSYAQSPFINRILGLTLNLMGGNAYVWHMQHNVLHHTYPNIDDTDDDIDIPFMLRMSPHQPRYWFHRFQHLYVWVLYAFATVFWVTSKDFVMLGKYKERNMLKEKHEYLKRFLNILLWKVVYFGYLLVIPIVLLDFPWYLTLTMFLVMHIVGGVLLSIIFQPAHVFTGTEFIQQADNQIDRSWHKYQLETTTNFKLNGFMTWLSGGLNYQIEHHLFPNICHVHYPRISRIVKKTVREFGLPYHLQRNLWAALYLHYDMLRELGQENNSY